MISAEKIAIQQNITGYNWIRPEEPDFNVFVRIMMERLPSRDRLKRCIGELCDDSSDEYRGFRGIPANEYTFVLRQD